jgi:hypothetical protein
MRTLKPSTRRAEEVSARSTGGCQDRRIMMDMSA